MVQSLKYIMIVLLAGFTMACNNNQKRTSNETAGEDKDSISGATATTAQANGNMDKSVKSVLILSSSPRKDGNSDILSNRFLEGAKEAGHQVEKIFLSEHKIYFIEGNYAGPPSFPEDDEADAIVEKMIQADVIVMATPVYYYAMSGQMKTMIDRTFFRFREMKDKEFYYIIAGADNNKEKFQPIVDTFRGFLEALPNPTEKGIIYGTGAYDKGAIKDTPSYDEAYQMGKNV